MSIVQLHLAGWKGPIWQKRSYDHLVRDEEELQALATYILGNPVRGGLWSRSKITDGAAYPSASNRACRDPGQKTVNGQFVFP
jgi:hypothetical protein